MKYHIGLDLGGTNIKGGILDADARVVVQDSIPTEAKQGPEHVFGRLKYLAESLMTRADIAKSDVTGVGIGTPGPCTPEGVVRRAPNLNNWTDVPLQSSMNEKLGLPVTVVNDANAAAFGEFWAGAGRDPSVRTMILLTLGTGVGGGIILDGQVYVGPHGAGAELGHCIVALHGRACGCGSHGCLEQYTSATAIARAARERIAAGEESSLKSLEKLTTRDVFDAAAAGDALAESVVDNACQYLGLACVNFARTFDPHLIVLGGGVAAAGQPLRKRVEQYFLDYNWKMLPPQTEIGLATLANDAGFIGAAGMTRR